MSKDKKADGLVQLPHDIEDQPAAASNGEPPAKAPPIRQKWSSPIQAMARIEQEMNGLNPKERGIVCAWFFATYGEFTHGTLRHPGDPANITIKPLGAQ